MRIGIDHIAALGAGGISVYARQLLSARLPLITTNAGGGPPDIVEDGKMGYFVEVASVDALYKCNEKTHLGQRKKPADGALRGTRCAREVYMGQTRATRHYGGLSAASCHIVEERCIAPGHVQMRKILYNIRSAMLCNVPAPCGVFQ